MHGAWIQVDPAVEVSECIYNPSSGLANECREHLKRVHSPVQCERCHEIFSGTDRAACLSKLAEHRKQAESCGLGDPSKKEGIDEAQWATLDKQNRKKNQEAHRVEKWFEIWEVLFPDAERPKSPCK